MQAPPNGDEREITDDDPQQASEQFPDQQQTPEQLTDQRLAPEAEKPRGNKVRAVIELLVTVGVAVGLALLVQAVLVKPYKIPSGSMIPTLAIGQRILVDRLDTHPALGDVVVFHPPAGAEFGDEGVCGDPHQGFGLSQACDADDGHESTATYVKRVVGMPGDHLHIIDGRVFRNGV